MDREEIIRMALEVFDEHPFDEGHVVSPTGYTWIDDKVVEFAALVAAKEREECARFLEETDICGDAVMDELAAAIRARGDHAQD